MTDATTIETSRTDSRPVSCGRNGAAWFCIWSKPQMERCAADGLRAEGFPVFLPLYRAKLPSREIRIDPLFPRYLFAQPDATEQWVRALYVRGVSGVIRDGLGRPRAVPHHDIARLIAVCDIHGVLIPKKPREWAPGQKARVTDGALTDLTGLCSRAAKDRIWIWLDILGQQREVEFAADLLELV